VSWKLSLIRNHWGSTVATLGFRQKLTGQKNSYNSVVIFVSHPVGTQRSAENNIAAVRLASGDKRSTTTSGIL